MFVAVKFYNFTALTILQLCHLQVSEESHNIISKTKKYLPNGSKKIILTSKLLSDDVKNASFEYDKNWA